jgi:hypothetical protein
MSVSFTTARFVEHEEFGTILAHDADDLEIGVNLANTNAYAVLDRLGYDTEYGLIGEADPADFMARAMLANVGQDDSGIDTATTYLIDGPVLTDCGRRAGYFDDTMRRLCQLAEHARANDLMIAWG